MQGRVKVSIKICERAFPYQKAVPTVERLHMYTHGQKCFRIWVLARFVMFQKLTAV